MTTRLGPGGYPVTGKPSGLSAALAAVSCSGAVASFVAEIDQTLAAVSGAGVAASFSAELDIALFAVSSAGAVAPITGEPESALAPATVSGTAALLTAKIEIAASGVSASGSAGTLSIASAGPAVPISGVYGNSFVVNFGNEIDVPSSQKKGKGKGQKVSKGFLNIILDDPYAVPTGIGGQLGVAISFPHVVTVLLTEGVGQGVAGDFDVEIDLPPDLPAVAATASVGNFTPAISIGPVAVHATGTAVAFAIEIDPNLPVTGVAGSGTVATFAPIIADLTGIEAAFPVVAAQGIAADLTTEFDIYLIGGIGTGAVESLAGTEFEVALADAYVTGVAGDPPTIEIDLDVSLADTFATGAASDLAISISPNISLAAAAAAGIAGEVFSDIRVDVPLEGVSAQGFAFGVEIGVTPLSVFATGVAGGFAFELIIEFGYLVCARIETNASVAGAIGVENSLGGSASMLPEIVGAIVLKEAVDGALTAGNALDGLVSAQPKVSGAVAMEECE